MNVRVIVVVGLLAVAGAVAAARNASPVAAPTPPPSADRSTVAGPGRVEPASEEIAVASEMTGRLAAVLVDEGDRVVAGQVVARLEQRDLAARAAAAAARLRVAEANLQRLLNGARAEERRESAAVLAQAAAELDHSRVQVERARRLFTGEVIARDALDAAERDHAIAVAAHRQAVERFAFIDAPARGDERAQADAAVEVARAELEAADAWLAKSEVRSPIDGTVLRRHKLAGEGVSLEASESVIVTIANTAVMRVRIEIDEREVAMLRLGQTGWVTAPAYGDTRFTGRVIRVAPMLGRKTVRTDEPAERIDTKVLEVLLELDPGHGLPVGLRVDAFVQR